MDPKTYREAQTMINKTSARVIYKDNRRHQRKQVCKYQREEATQKAKSEREAQHIMSSNSTSVMATKLKQAQVKDSVPWTNGDLTKQKTLKEMIKESEVFQEVKDLAKTVDKITNKESNC